MPQLRGFVRALEAGSESARGANTSEDQQLLVRVLRECECWCGCLVLCGREDVEEVRSAMDEVALQLAGGQSGGQNLFEDRPRAEEQHTTPIPLQNTILDVRVEAIANHESISIVQNLVEAIDPERDSLAAPSGAPRAAHCSCAPALLPCAACVARAQTRRATESCRSTERGGRGLLSIRSNKEIGITQVSLRDTS